MWLWKSLAAAKSYCRRLARATPMGWSALTEMAMTHFQARALSRVQSIAFDGAKLAAAFEYDHELAYQMMKRLLALVTGRLERTRMQIVDVYGKLEAAHP